MRKHLLFIGISVLLLFSCKQKEEPRIWGLEDYYEDFLWCKHIPDTLKREIRIAINLDAYNSLGEDRCFVSLYEKEESIFRKIDSSKMLLCTDKLQHNDNHAVINRDNFIYNTDNDEYEYTDSLGIVLLPECPEGEFQLYLRVEAFDSLHVLNNIENYCSLDESDQMILIPYVLKKTIKENPLLSIVKFLAIVVFVIILLLLLFYFAKKRLYVIGLKKFTNGEQIAIFSPTGRLKNEVTGLKTTDLHGYVKLVVTRKPPQKQSKYDVLFKTGRVGYFVNKSIPSEDYFEIYPLSDKTIYCKKEEKVLDVGKKEEITLDKINDVLSSDFRIKFI